MTDEKHVSSDSFADMDDDELEELIERIWADQEPRSEAEAAKMARLRAVMAPSRPSGAATNVG